MSLRPVRLRHARRRLDRRRRAPFPDGDRPWAVETRGIEPVADEDRHGSARDLLWLWMAANLGVIGTVSGAVGAAMGLDFTQIVGVAAAGTAGSFVLVGLLGVSGQRTGKPMLALSSEVFGRWGNLGPASMSWLSLVGWETVTAVVAADALGAALGVPTPAHVGRWWILAALPVVVGAAVLVSRLGHATIAVVQRAVAWVFGIATLAVVAGLAAGAGWQHLADRHPAAPSALVAALSVVAAGAGISWVNVAADYTRYLPRTERPGAVVGWTVLGASAPLAALVVVGAACSSAVPKLVSTSDPVAALGSVLPGWAVGAYFGVAVVGLLAQIVLGLYSSGLTLQAMGVRVRRDRTVVVDAVVMLCAGGAVIADQRAFLASFESFVELLACPVASWAAVFLVGRAVHRLRRVGLPRWFACGAWTAGTAVGVLCTSSPLFSGPLAGAMSAGSSVGYVVGAAFAAGVSLAGAVHGSATQTTSAPSSPRPSPWRGQMQAEPVVVSPGGEGEGEAAGH